MANKPVKNCWEKFVRSMTYYCTKIFKESKPKLLKKFSADIYIWKKDKSGKCKYEIKDSLDVSDEKINFAYNNAISFMQEIKDGMKTINTRTTLLLGYLATLVTALSVFIFNYEKYSIFIIIFSLIVLSGYLIIIFIIAKKLISPSSGYSTYSEPKNLMNKAMFEYDIKMIKIFEIELLQDRISFNIQRQKKSAKYLKCCILATFAIPIISALLSFVFTIFLAVVCFQV